MAKLTLSVDDGVVSSAKRYAKRRGISVSEIVENYLASLSSAAPPAVHSTPILRSLRGVLKGGDIADYRKHLVSKYR